MANFIRFVDSVTFRPIGVSQKIKDFYTISTPGRSMRVRLAATHSGIITRNNGFYLPHKMRDGTASWTAQYGKPVLIHHERHEDAIGRVYRARYVDISTGLGSQLDSSKLKDSFSSPVPSPALLEAFIQGKLSPSECLSIVDKYFIADNAILDDPGYEGLGYIELIVDVTDSDAIQKVLDRRYLTGSVGASTDSAICSICKKDWAEDEGVCEHRPGEKYEGKKCFLIAGNLTYDEYSFVNTPADRHSRVIEVNVAGVQDFINVNNNDKIPEVDLVLDEEATPMKLEEAVALLRKISPSLQDSEVPKRAQKILDHIQEKELFKDKEEKEHESIFTKISEELSKDDSPPPPPVDPIREFWGAEYDDIVGDDEWGKEYAKMIMESLTEVPELKDKKLNAASRKKLAGSTFCGPNRSYPVPDCGHAKSAMAYAKKNSAGSAVIACVRRKAKRLGCPFSDAADVGQFISDYFDTFSDDEMVQMFDGLLKEAEERGVSLSDCGTKVLEERITELESQLQTVKTDTTASLQKDIETLENSLADAVKELRNAKVSKIVDFKRLTGDKTEKLEDQFQDQTAEVLDSTLKDLISKVDIVKIADKLNSGLSNIPNTTVPDPTLIQDADKNNKPKYNIDIMKAIGERYLALRMKSQTVAENFLRDAKAMGLVPVEYPIKDKS